MKRFFLLFSVLSVLAPETYGSLPIYPAEIIARELSMPGLGWSGHVGITTAPNIAQDAYQVIEVLWESPVIQTNTIANFKTKSLYWGSRYGISDRGNNALRILREANFQKDLGCATYTLTASYDVSKGSYDGTVPHPTHCGFFRCDTFVNYVFNWGNYRLPTYSPPGSIEVTTLPKLVFNAFPYGNGDGPLSIKAKTLQEAQYSLITLVNNKQKGVSINSVTAKQLAEMSPKEFVSVVDVSTDEITNKGANNILAFALDPALNVEERRFLMDKLGFVGTVDMIPKLIELYYTLNEDNSAVKNQIVATTQNLYQRHLKPGEDSREKDLLQQFYTNLLDQKVSATEKGIILRGFLALSSYNVVVSNVDKINALFNSREANLHPRIVLGLKIELVNKSNELEKIYISDIINMLGHENSAELDGVFNAFIVERLSHLGVNSLVQDSKNQIAAYLESVGFKYSQQNKIAILDDVSMFSYGGWLEASALVNSSSLEEAAQYIAQYLQDRSTTGQESFIIGLSNSTYMQKAFKTEPVLVDFKKKHKAIYLNTVGLPKR